MAKCKICKTNIPDGTEYCNNCQDKREMASNESYLDGLLNLVKNDAPTVESIYKKKSIDLNSEAVSTNAKEQKTQEGEPFLTDFEPFSVDLSDVEEFDKFNMEDDLEELDNDVAISDEELFGNDISDLLYDQASSSINEVLSETKDNGTEEEPVTDSQSNELTQPEDLELSMEEEKSEEVSSADISAQPDEILQEANEQELSDEYTADVETEQTEPYNQNTDSQEKEEFDSEEEDDFDPDLNELLNNLENFQNNGIELPGKGEMKSSSRKPALQENKEEPEQEEPEQEEPEQEEPEQEDFLSLLNQIAPDDPVADDVNAIKDLLNGAPASPKQDKGVPSDVGEVFSDALKVVTSLNDAKEEEDLLNSITDSKDNKSEKNNKAKNNKAKNKKEKKKKEKKEKKASKNKKQGDGEANEPKKSLLQRIFGNVKDEEVPEKEAQPAKDNTDKIPVAKRDDKKGKVKQGAKGKPSKNTSDEVSEGEAGKEKATGAKESKKGKKEKKEKIKKNKEVIQVIDEIEEDEGKINLLGATFVFVFFGLLAALLYFGTSVASYTISIQNATDYFDNQKYTEAYYEVYGMQIKDEDIEIYDKIRTINFVNKQLNSYNNYYSLKMYPEALDSLLKGLKRYDKYIELATKLGIQTDMNYVRKQLLAELDNVFHLSEKAANRIISSDSHKEYSLEVYNVVLENMSN